MSNQPVLKDINVAELAAWLRRPTPPILLDVRDPDEQATGCIVDALLLPRALLESRIRALVPDQSTPVVAYCAGGARSDLAVQALHAMGYQQAFSLRGGFIEWQRAGFEWIVPAADFAPGQLTAEQNRRYARHLRLPEIGSTGQRKLLDASVLCVGAGGLGSPASLYLAAAGVGRLGIVDDDVVELSNLQRQILHTESRIGMLKIDSAAQTLTALNSDCHVTKIPERLTANNALTILADYDVIVDGSDNFATRYLINDTALRLAKPVVHAAIQGFEGQLTVFAATGAPCYRCLFPEAPPAGVAPSCQEAGVLGVLPGVMGILQATEAVKLILNLGDSLVGRFVIYDALALRFRELKMRRDPNCLMCGDKRV